MVVNYVRLVTGISEEVDYLRIINETELLPYLNTLFSQYLQSCPTQSVHKYILLEALWILTNLFIAPESYILRFLYCGDYPTIDAVNLTVIFKVLCQCLKSPDFQLVDQALWVI